MDYGLIQVCCQDQPSIALWPNCLVQFTPTKHNRKWAQLVSQNSPSVHVLLAFKLFLGGIKSTLNNQVLLLMSQDGIFNCSFPVNPGRMGYNPSCSVGDEITYLFSNFNGATVLPSSWSRRNTVHSMQQGVKFVNDVTLFVVYTLIRIKDPVFITIYDMSHSVGFKYLYMAWILVDKSGLPRSGMYSESPWSCELSTTLGKFLDVWWQM